MFYFERESKSPLYRQLYEELRRQITEGSLPKGSRLPPTRKLSSEYRISRNTVIQAYQQLEIEGYVRSTVGSGYYVEDLSPFLCSHSQRHQVKPILPRTGESKILYDFYYGNLDYNCYQSRAWRQCLVDACDYIASQNNLAYSVPEGLPELRQELADYLYLSRGVRCSADQIILTSGHQHSLTFDNNERTIYMGTFSKSLSPDLRIAYLVLPRQLFGKYHIPQLQRSMALSWSSARSSTASLLA